MNFHQTRVLVKAQAPSTTRTHSAEGGEGSKSIPTEVQLCPFSFPLHSFLFSTVPQATDWKALPGPDQCQPRAGENISAAPRAWGEDLPPGTESQRRTVPPLKAICLKPGFNTLLSDSSPPYSWGLLQMHPRGGGLVEPPPEAQDSCWGLLWGIEVGAEPATS